MNVDDLRGQRLALIDQMRAAHEEADGREGGPTEEDAQRSARIGEEIRTLSTRIAETENLERMKAEDEEARAASHDLLERTGTRSLTDVETDPAEVTNYRKEDNDALRSWLLGENRERKLDLEARDIMAGAIVPERRTLFAGGRVEHRTDMGVAVPDSNTGLTVGSTFVAELIRKLQEFSNIRQYVRQIRTSRGEPMTWPRQIGNSVAEWMDERDPYTTTRPTFDNFTLGAHKGGRISVISIEALQDSAIDIGGLIIDELVDALTQLQDEAFMNGDGTAKPTGLVPTVTVGKTAAAIAIDLDDLIDLQFAIIQPYRPNAFYLVSDEAALEMMKIKDGQGQYLWQPSAQMGQPDRFRGKPVVTDSRMPAVAANSRPVLYGDYRRSYIVRDSLGVEIVRSDEYAFDTDAVAFKVRARTDGNVYNADAAVALVMAAT